MAKDQYFGIHCDQHGPDRAELVSHLTLENLDGCSMEEQWALLESSQKLWVGLIEGGNSSELVRDAKNTTEVHPTKVLVYDTEMKVFKRITREGLDGKRGLCSRIDAVR